MPRDSAKAMDRVGSALEAFQAIVEAARRVYRDVFEAFFPTRQVDLALAPPVFEMPEYPTMPPVQLQPLPLVVDRHGFVRVDGS